MSEEESLNISEEEDQEEIGLIPAPLLSPKKALTERLQLILENVDWHQYRRKWTYFYKEIGQNRRRPGVFRLTKELCARHIMETYGRDWEKFVVCLDEI